MVKVNIGDIYIHDTISVSPTKYKCIGIGDEVYYCIQVGDERKRQLQTSKNDKTIKVIKRAIKNAYPIWF